MPTFRGSFLKGSSTYFATQYLAPPDKSKDEKSQRAHGIARKSKVRK